MQSIAMRVYLVMLVALVLAAVLLGWGRVHEARIMGGYEFDARLAADAAALTDGMRTGDDGRLMGLSSAVHRAALSHHEGESAWAAFDEDGNRLIGEGPAPQGESRSEPYDLAVERDGSSVKMRMLVRRVLVPDPSGTPRPVTVALSRSTRAMDRSLHSLERTQWREGMMLVGIASAVFFAIRLAFRPFRRATESLREAEGHTAVPLESMPTEILPFVERINELMAAQQAALAREKQFTGNVAHELRTPLAVLHTGLQVLARRIGEHHEETVGDLRDTVGEMSTLVDNLLSLSRSESARAQAPVLVAPVVRSVWARLEAAAEARGLVFESTVPDDAELSGSEHGLRVILTNLLSNATEYTEDGGRIVVAVPPDGLVSVWDSGPVPGAQQRARMFDRLWRADQARTEATAHAGLGLSIAQSLGESMGLQLVVDAPPEGGLRFVLRPRD